MEEEKHVERLMQGVSVSTLGKLGGLLTALVGFAILVGGYVAFVEKKPIRSDYMVYFLIFNVTLLVGVMVTWYYTQERSIRTE